MRYGLLATDISAVLLGLFGLAALGSFALYVDWQMTWSLGRMHVMAGFALLLGSMALLFLWPPLYQRMVQTTFPLPMRIVFVLLSAAWLFWALAYLRQVAGIGGPVRDAVQANFGSIAGVVLALFAITIFPFGFSYSDLRAERRARRRAAREAAAERVAVDLPRVGRAQTRPGGASAARAPSAHASRRTGNGLGANLAWGVVLGLGALGLYAWLAGLTVQTLEVERALNRLSMPVIGGATVTAWILAAAFWSRLRAFHTRSGGRQGPVRSFFGVVLGFPLLIAACWIGLAYCAFPFAWNALTENPVARQAYIVESVSRGRRTKGCIDLLWEPGGAEQTTICGLGRDFAYSLVPGDVLVVEGELSRFGHRFERWGVAR